MVRDACDSLFQVRVYYEDTDHGGVVYHANYLRFMERARTEMLREKGYELDVLEQDPGILFVVRRAQLDFRAPARFNDLLQIKSVITRKTPVRMNFQQHIFNQNKLLCSGEIEVVCLEAKTFRPHVIPAVLLQAFPLCVHP
ncbi:tol-pal system-associated acyl-CoA thioesterase [Acidithiobacillus montserratensis]|uniref:Tol-pal system-associated acyl-CoA thioesterase n=1 Tax=Acidithiobacillus montserratensis TaxID=2729135 RepID=A0ACD5HJI3_9PROT|nr:tol-pal system-associated acyl-CoA thioesterase [Acidithiobacillus montserratensis]MBN2679991.1 tol-pal system-associated acyl-CoA thioesterase [Acidithiobacillaceae bacterium]MBU2746969.1 tol-pal system-associated acyl-CoA thioesterase [Acidithiobacillus montserratensis]